MEEFKVNGIVLKSNNYKERDVLITIFTVELGKITAVLKGVKKESAKLKFASQPFCFALFVLVKNGDNYTVTQADLIESFFDLTTNYDKFLVASDLLIYCNLYLRPNIVSEFLFITLLNALKLITFEDVNEKFVQLKFVLEILKTSGYELNFEQCNKCGSKLMESSGLSMETGEIVCNNCLTGKDFLFSKQSYSLLKIIYATPIEKLKSIKISQNVLSELKTAFVNNFKQLLGI